LLSQTLTALEKQWVLDQAVTTGDDYHLDKSSPTACLILGPHSRRRRREKQNKGIGYLKENLDSQF
jgi:hypothetical protein